MSTDGISYNEVQRRELLAFVQRLAALEVNAWMRDGEDVVTMSKCDCQKIADGLEEARIITAKYAALPL